MEHHEILDRRFPDRILTIRRLIRDDSAFRELCADFESAAAALHYWRSPPRRSPERAKEYERLVDELVAEIETMLSEQKF